MARLECDLRVEKAAPGVWSTPGAQPVREVSGLYRLLPVLTSVWINLDSRDLTVVVGERSGDGVAGIPAEVDAFAFFGPGLVAASRPCPGCGSSTMLSLGIRGGERAQYELGSDGQFATIDAQVAGSGSSATVRGGWQCP